MEIKDHKKGTVDSIWILIFLIGILVYYLIRNDFKIQLILVVIWVIGVMCLTYYIGYEKKVYYIDNNGIVAKWFGIIPINYKWNELKYVEKCSLYSFTINGMELDGIVCSRIPIKYKTHPAGDSKKVISMDWPMLRPKYVVVIYMKDFEAGQYGEFWNYVPERLKT